MMNIQEVFNRIQTLKKEQKEIRGIYRDALANSAEYQKILEEYNTTKNKKKEIVEAIKSDLRSEIEKLEQFKNDIGTDQEILSDIALNHIVKGEMIELEDEYNNKYEPQFSVRFKKI